jgi:hypothetical protein
MNQELEEMFVDNKFVVTYQNPRTAREHKVLVTKCDLIATLEWHRNRGNLINYIPAIGAMDEKHL